MFRCRRPSLRPSILSAALLLSACASAPAPPPAVTASMGEGALRARSYDEDVSGYGLFLAGATAMTQGRSEEAAELLARASRTSPEDAALRERAFTASLLAGNVDAAASLAPGASAAGAAPTALVSLGRLVRAVDALAAQRGADAEILLAPGMIGSPHDAAAALLQPWAAAQAGAPPPAPRTATLDKASDDEASLGRARLLERAGRYPDAAVLFRARLSSGGPGAALDAGAFFERRGRRAEALAVYDAALVKSPADPVLTAARVRVLAGGPAPAAPTLEEGAAEALITPAAAFVAHRQPEFGLIYLRLALRLDPRFAQAWLLVGDSLAAGGDTSGAIEAYRRVAPDQREYAAARGRLAIRLQADGEKAQALALAQEAAALAPDDLAAQVLYAEVLRDDARYADAVPVLDRVIASHGGDVAVGAQLHFLRGAVLERDGRWRQAEPDLKQAVAGRPNDPEMLNYLGFAWADRGEHLGEALAMLERAAAADPEDGAILDSVGWARFKLGDMPGAVRDLEKAVALTPADTEVNDHLGDAYQRVGRRVEATYQWRRVLSLDPTPSQRAGVEAKLKALTSPAAS